MFLSLNTDPAWREKKGPFLLQSREDSRGRHPFSAILQATIQFAQETGTWSGMFLRSQAADVDKHNDQERLLGRRLI